VLTLCNITITSLAIESVIREGETLWMYIGCLEHWWHGHKRWNEQDSSEIKLTAK